jgi:hypothetical protein
MSSLYVAGLKKKLRVGIANSDHIRALAIKARNGSGKNNY